MKFGGVGKTVNKYTILGKAIVFNTLLLPIMDNLNLLYMFNVLSISLIFYESLAELFFLV